MNDEQRGKDRMRGTPHCCPICCTAAQKGGKHAPLWLTEDDQWYCPRAHGDDED